MFPLSIHNYFELAALLISLICWGRLKDTTFKWFPLFLFLICFADLYGHYIRQALSKPNAWLYNISVPIEYLFFAFLFGLNYQTKLFRRVAFIFLPLFFVFALSNMAFIQGFVKFNTNILKAGSFFMIVFSCLYFTELLRQERHIALLKEPMFWVATGVLLFNTGDFCYAIFSDYLIQHHFDRTRKLFKLINNKLVWVLYTCLIISFLCTKRKSQRV